MTTSAPTGRAPRGAKLRQPPREAWLVIVSGFFEPFFYLVALEIGVVCARRQLISAANRLRVRGFVAPALSLHRR